MQRLDEEYTAHPFYGSRRMTAMLQRAGYPVNRKRMIRLMVRLGLQAIYPKPATSRPGAAPPVYPYLLRGLTVTAPDQVWSTDITYLRLDRGFGYLTAILDWHSRKVLAWRLSNTLETAFCLDCLDEALVYRRPAIFTPTRGRPVHQHRFHRSLGAGRYSDQHGWAGLGA